jgi:hypothetical protein
VVEKDFLRQAVRRKLRNQIVDMIGQSVSSLLPFPAKGVDEIDNALGLKAVNLCSYKQW